MLRFYDNNVSKFLEMFPCFVLILFSVRKSGGGGKMLDFFQEYSKVVSVRRRKREQRPIERGRRRNSSAKTAMQVSVQVKSQAASLPRMIGENVRKVAKVSFRVQRRWKIRLTVKKGQKVAFQIQELASVPMETSFFWKTQSACSAKSFGRRSKTATHRPSWNSLTRRSAFWRPICPRTSKKISKSQFSWIARSSPVSTSEIADCRVVCGSIFALQPCIHCNSIAFF